MADRSVLIVDDDEDIRESLIGCLEGEGYRPMAAPNGRLALELLAGLDSPPCLIVLDLMMPVMDGRSFREEQLRSPALADIPVVLISAYVPDPGRIARELKIPDYLSKPVDPEVLLQLIESKCLACRHA
jgi:CheY-like chemotaxis protein